MMQRIAYLNKSKKGIEYFKIGNETYVILERPIDEIGMHNNFSSKKVICQIKNDKK